MKGRDLARCIVGDRCHGNRPGYCVCGVLLAFLAPALAAAPVCGTCGGGGRYVVGHVYGGTAAPCPDCNGTGRAPGEGRGT